MAGISFFINSGHFNLLSPNLTSDFFRLSISALVSLFGLPWANWSVIGFAFLPTYAKQGYAFEASAAVLADLFKSNQHQTILATTLKENSSSIQLLQKLGFVFSKEITNENDTLQLFSINKND